MILPLGHIGGDICDALSRRLLLTTAVHGRIIRQLLALPDCPYDLDDLLARLGCIGMIALKTRDRREPLKQSNFFRLIRVSAFDGELAAVSFVEFGGERFPATWWPRNILRQSSPPNDHPLVRMSGDVRISGYAWTGGCAPNQSQAANVEPHRAKRWMTASATDLDHVSPAGSLQSLFDLLRRPSPRDTT